MCNLIRYKAEIQAVHGAFPEMSDVRITPRIRFKVAPSEPAPVLTLVEGTPRVSMMRFGLATGRGRQLMARGETVTRLPMFRHAFRQRRCLIIAHGFYDSLDMGSYRQPWHLHLKGDDVMCFAGLWESTPQADNFTIISTPANAVVARVIDRMPAILPQPLWRAWLQAGSSEKEITELQSMLTPLPADLMEAWPVTRQVNQRGFESPECLTPVVPEQGELDL